MSRRQVGKTVEPSEILELNSLRREDRVALMGELGYRVRGDLMYLPDGQPAVDRYTGEQLRLSNTAIVPGSVILIDNNPVSLAAYIAEQED